MRIRLILIGIATLGLVASSGCSSDDGGAPDAGVDMAVSPDLPPNRAFGQACDNPGGLCKEKVNGRDLFCIATQAGAGTGRGFCSLECTQPVGGECYGTANATFAKCSIQGAAVNDASAPPMYCAFMCETSGRSYTCPPTLECDPKATSGEKTCIPRSK
jgi:hypothetical protein